MDKLSISDTIRLLDPEISANFINEIQYHDDIYDNGIALDYTIQACKIASDILREHRKDKHMLYQIKKITHTGTCGEKGTVRTDGRYPLRIGRVVEMKFPLIEVGCPMTLHYVYDSDGSPLKLQYIRTSTVISKVKNNKKVIITTRNSVFEFEEYEDY